eukprot:GFKZ01003690.1.p1 GENE.GFKZ01003690.1~~GFKZ01003690.1.p1  ORF type:complete len:145 (+),score=24.48 GFKZ01003690.1:140-574(+)
MTPPPPPAFLTLPPLLNRTSRAPLVQNSTTTTFNIKSRAMVRASTIVEKGAGMRIIQRADEETIARLGCRSWSKWGCIPSTFPWAYDADEVALILEGEFSVIPDDGSEKMDVVAGDVVYFPSGMSCTWEVRKAVEKYFAFGKKL